MLCYIFLQHMPIDHQNMIANSSLVQATEPGIHTQHKAGGRPESRNSWCRNLLTIQYQLIQIDLDAQENAAQRHLAFENKTEYLTHKNGPSAARNYCQPTQERVIIRKNSGLEQDLELLSRRAASKSLLATLHTHTQ